MESTLREQIRRWLRQEKLGRVIYTCDQHLHAGRLPPEEEQAELLYWKGQAHMASGARGYGNAHACFKEASALARRAPHLQGQILCMLSALYTDTCNAPELERVLAQFRKLVRSHPAVVGPLLPCVLFNAALAFEHTNQLADARQSYLEAIEVVDSHGLDPSLGDPNEWLGMAIHNLGGIELKLGHLEAAWSAMERARTYRADEEFEQKRLSRLAQYHLAANNLPDAQEYVTATLARDGVSASTKADLFITWACVLQRLGRPDEAREKALTGLDYAVSVTHVTAIHEIHQLLKELPPGGAEP